MGWFGRLIGTDKAVDDILDKDKGLLVRAGGWVDGLQHTDQEKASDNQVTRNWGLKWLQALEPFKVVQRIIAFTVLSMWAFVGINIVIAIWVDSFLGTKVASELLKFAFSDYMFWPTVMVLSLYVGGGVVKPELFSSLRKRK